MAGKIKEGQSVYIPFLYGESVIDNHMTTRVYSTRAKFERSYPDPDLPTLVEYAPVVHGRWTPYIPPLYSGDAILRCSRCGMSIGEARAPYCPNCGAKMDSEE